MQIMHNGAEMRLLSFDELKSEKGIRFSRVHIGRLVKAGLFPKPVKVGVRSIAWIDSEIDAYQEKAAAARSEAA